MTIHSSHRNGLSHDTAIGSALSQSIHNKPKYHLRAGTEYLHFSGLKLTRLRYWAWVGTIEQARACRKRFDAAAGCKIRAIRAIPQHEEMEV